MYQYKKKKTEKKKTAFGKSLPKVSNGRFHIRTTSGRQMKPSCLQKARVLNVAPRVVNKPALTKWRSA